MLLAIARDLTAALASEDRYARLLEAVCRVVPCDAACLMKLETDVLHPLSARGLLPAALGVVYPRQEHPRLDVVLSARGPVRFPADSSLPDPFDGLVAGNNAHAVRHVHDCLGIALSEGGDVVGALTFDAFEPGAFDGLTPEFLDMLAALAGAALRTSALMDALVRRVEHRERVAHELQRGIDVAIGGSLIGNSAALQRLLRDIAIVAKSELATLITGETGVGKELVARQVHASSPRGSEPLIYVNCAALPESVAESELFGHVAGAFTGAVRDRAGKFEVANGGTLFLDEIGELPAAIQPKLLRALQQGEIQRVGSDRPHRVDVRVIAATNRDLPREIERGRFRADLFHRLAAFPLHVPALRERREDIPLLAQHFADGARRRLGTGPIRFAKTALERLAAADWPGNVRELENVVGRAALRASFGREPDEAILIGPAHLDLDAVGQEGATSRAEAALPLRERVVAFQRQAVMEALERHGGGWADAARELGMDRSNLFHLARRLGISRPQRARGEEPSAD
ncbi:MAG TPA: nitric oxide reductase transcriptional regulator NorR [Polyangiaceae bacterium]|nr:nitric oxide reductase transcriptional regulator NorR [Polyangiaceae bacterium]